MPGIIFQSALKAQYFCCFFMTGIIWLIQILHYPSFKFIAENRFKEFHSFHSSRITYIVAPVMVVELLTAFALCWSNQAVYTWNFILVILLWALTGFISVPIHNSLSVIYDLKKIDQLVNTNWFRTAIWTFRSAAILYFITSQ